MHLRSILFVLLASGALGASDALHYELGVELDPEVSHIEVRGRVSNLSACRPAADGVWEFSLHAAMRVRAADAGWRVEEVSNAATTGGGEGLDPVEGAPLRRWRLFRQDPSAGDAALLSWHGRILHELDAGEEYQRGFSETPGLIGPDGVFLAGSTHWVPDFCDALLTIDLEIEAMPGGWEAVSTGARDGGGVGTVWTTRRPVDEVYLIAGPWRVFEDATGSVPIYAFLREAADAESLAARYLEAGRRYIAMYESMLTPYPWPSFAVVENFWDTGYGMPGFTLLGPRILRFPFILTSSYPHEILHEWWGNSVYLDAGGNWCEGLTAYMADHMFAEQRGEGALHRRATLQKYTDFVREAEDFPLSEFRRRHSAETEAVGYGKSLMLFHMLRRGVGDEVFLEALARFHRDHAFQAAGFDDLADAFGRTTDEDWGPWFAAWTERTGAPRVVIQAAEVRHRRGAWSLDLTLRQEGAGAPWPLSVPVAVTTDAGETAFLHEVAFRGRRAQARLVSGAGRPLRLDVDPAFDVMRRLDPREVPPALSTMFGEDDPLYVLPSQASEAEREAWRELAAAWSGEGEPRVVLDRDLDALPAGAVWVLGWANRLRDAVVAAHRDEIGALDPGDGGGFLERRGSRVVLERKTEDPALAAAWVAAEPLDAIAGLARKLPHYTRYSWLAFRGPEPENTGKGMWQPIDSPLTVALNDGPLPPLRLPEREPLAEPPPRFDAGSLESAVQALAAPALGGRGLGSRGLERATGIVETALARTGLEPAGSRGFRQTWTVPEGPEGVPVEVTNLLARKRGSDPKLQDSPVLVMAHLDHLGTGWPDVRAGNEGKIHPGADDNASGVAALLSIAREIGGGPPAPRPVLFAVTTGEEAGLLGARRLLSDLAEEGRLPAACVNLDTVGRLEDGKVLVLGASSAREWRFLWMGVGYTTGLELDFAAEPLAASDQVACHEHGVPGVQVTTGPHADYHSPGDTAEAVDAEGLAEIAEGVRQAVVYLAERTEPLTSQLAGAEAGAQPRRPTAGPRRASLGTMPDFAHSGPGVRVQEVMPDSAAQAAGIEAGDVLVAFDGEEVEGLRAFSELLERHAPGDRVEVVVLRGGTRIVLEAVLRQR